MHVYIYDSFVVEKKFDSQIAKIETRLTDLGLNGKIIRLGLLQSLKESVHNEIKKGAKTIIVVGGNAILHKIVNAVISFYTENDYAQIVPIGIIPIENKNSSFAQKLGIPVGADACNILSARRIEELDVGKINNKFFLGEAIIQTEDTSVNVDGSYTIEINEAGEIAVVNMLDQFKLPDNFPSNAQDGHLDFCINTSSSNKLLSLGKKTNTPSIFNFQELTISNKKGSQITIDNVEQVDTPATINLASKKLRIIVGKERGL
ncbi:hypothetical protein C0583_04395 [Candidatus Parcubacteria bacterium]|nr:MAG: hypothetical protein C0583_04395 [Candidatus Parcubacteria bacterium]